MFKYFSTLDVITIGSTTVDVFMETNFDFISWDTALEKAMVIPFGEKFAASNASIFTGGNALNAAVTFARQGLKVASVIKTGNDIFGSVIKEQLQAEGVNNKFVMQDEILKTSYSVIFLQNGERSIVTHHGAGERLVIKDLDFNKMKARWWYVSLPGNSYKLFPYIAKMAKKMGVKLALNPSIRHIKEDREQLISNLKYVDFLVLNEGEASELTNIHFSNEAGVFNMMDEMTPGIVAITRGSEGSIILSEKNIFRVGVLDKVKMIDRTGAGDAYGAGFVAGLIRAGNKNYQLEHTLQQIKYAISLAVCNSAMVVTKIGASSGAIYKNNFDSSSKYKKIKIDIQNK